MNEHKTSRNPPFCAGFLLWTLASVQAFWIAEDYGVTPPVSRPLLLGIATASGLLLTVLARLRRFTSLRTLVLESVAVLAASFLAFLISLVGDVLLARWECHLPRVAGLGTVARAALNTVGLACHETDNMVYAGYPTGLIGIVPTFEKCAFRPLTAWLVMSASVGWFSVGIKSLWTTLVSLLLAVAALVGWFTLGISRMMEIDGLLAVEYPSKIRYLWDPWALSGVLGLLTLATAALHKDWKPWPIRSTPWGAPARAAALGLGFLAFTAPLILGYVDPGTPSAGRVLVDDYHSEFWEPSARQASPRWVGDYSTYNYNALVQHLGNRFDVSVNLDSPLTAGLLTGYDVVILKTPGIPYDQEEIEAVHDFVRRGGGLLLVGDHTNLMWMSEHLNAISRRTGMTFRLDMLATASSGGFNEYEGTPLLPIHPGLRDLPSFEFMTSCSIDPGPRGKIVMAVPDALRHANDYANSSYFGPLGHDPQFEAGNQAVVAETSWGEGTIVAVADSTPFSTFSYFMKGHDQLILNLVTRLNRKAHFGEWPLSLLLAAASLLFVGTILVTVQGSTGGVHWLCVAAIMGWAGGVGLQRSYIREFFAPPDARRTPPVVTFLEGGAYSAYPPTLGGTGTTPVEALFDTLYCLPVRLGWESRLSRDHGAAFREDPSAVVVVNPVLPEAPSVIEAAVDYVYGGGVLILADRSQHVPLPVSNQYLDAFGLEMHVHGDAPHRLEDWHSSTLQEVLKDGAAGLRAWAAPAGAGRVVFLAESDRLSRSGIGHNFSFPTAEENSRRDLFIRLLQDVLHLGSPEPPSYRIVPRPQTGTRP